MSVPEWPDPVLITASEPKVFWIELTSRCPFRCLFCSRELLRGRGAHMPFASYRRLIAQLNAPEVIRLNYAGESLIYPRVIEAIRLGKAKGATVEIVTALPPISEHRMQQLVTSGLDLLTISLHTMDPGQYPRIFGRGSLSGMMARLQRLLHIRKRLGSHTPVIDLSFVAMQRNLAQLPRVAAFAGRLGLDGVNVHRVIRRDPIRERFNDELNDNRLRPLFRTRLKQTLAETKRRFPNLRLSLANNATEDNTQVGRRPDFHAGTLPDKARIRSCIEDPWETVHILCDGRVFPCGCGSTPATLMGNVNDDPLAAIWHGPAYMAFRKGYVRGEHPTCRDCAWKIACLPSPAHPVVDMADGGNGQLLRGWFPESNEKIAWSKAEGILVLKNRPGTSRLRVTGILPHAVGPATNRLIVNCNHRMIGSIANASPVLMSFDETLDISAIDSTMLYVSFRTEHLHQPFREGIGADKRSLGFALMKAEIV